MGSDSAASGPLVIVGAGYAGVRVAQVVDRAARGAIPIVLLDRHPSHVLRTELYSVGELAASPSPTARFSIPLEQMLRPGSVEFRRLEVVAIDLDRREVRGTGAAVPYRSLVIALGSVPAFFGVPGAKEHAENVYRLATAVGTSTKLRELARSSTTWTPGRRPEILVIGGGSTGTEVAAEIATVDWGALTGVKARPPHVRLLTGALPFLAGLPPRLVAHARELLGRSGVNLDEGHNVRSLTPGTATLDDGSTRSFDLAVWAAGVQAPDLVRALPGRHGHSGRLATGPTLELDDRPGVFAVGDVVEVADPRTGAIVPATAQAALAEAETVGRNVVARWNGRPLRPFRYRENGVIVSVGLDAASASVRRVPIWGRPAKLLKTAVEREYAVAATLRARTRTHR